MPAKIINIEVDSIAAEMDLKPGDKLLSINGHPIKDILDYQFYAQDDYITLEIEKEDQEIWSIEIEKDYDEQLGLGFGDMLFDRMKSCRNRCIFCFVDQLPPLMRRSLYIKDDDYRHSFICGNFITLTNLSEDDWEKIITMHLSPLYVSVHCIQSDLRKEMLQNDRAGNIKEDLIRLQRAGIEIHTQIVLCPGWNDGDKLNETIEELAGLYPAVSSVGIVPVGLTGHRQDLPNLTPITLEIAKAAIMAVDIYQKRFRVDLGKGLVYLADEFYLQAGQDLPPAGYYDDYCQIENGIGLGRLFLDQFQELESELPSSIEERTVYIITGQSAALLFKSIVARLNQIEGLSVAILPVVNHYFGGGVTVAGLLTGRDIAKALGSRYQHQRVIIPGVVFREGQDMLLDDITLDQIMESSQADIRVAEGSARSLIEAIFGA